MIFRNNWGMFMLDCYFDNLKQPNGEYRVGLRICCDEDDSTKSIIDFAKDLVGPVYADKVKVIRFIDNCSELCGKYAEYDLEATVDCIFKDRDEAYHFVYVLGSMPVWPDKSFVEVEAIIDGMLNDDTTIIGIDMGE